MVLKEILVLFLQIFAVFADTANPRVKVSIETNFGDTLKGIEDGGESSSCGRIVDDSLPIGRFPWFAKIYVSKVRSYFYL